MEQEKKVFVVTVECLFRKYVEVEAKSVAEAMDLVKYDHAHGDNIPEFEQGEDIWDSLLVTTAAPKEDEKV